MNAARSTSGRNRMARRLVAVGVGAAAAVTLGVAPASASPDVTTTTTHETLRLVDEENGILYFVNKSRAELCTPERLAFEALLEAWFDGGAVGDPPAEPVSSSQGVAEVRRTTRVVNGRTVVTTVGDDVPVEAWRLDSEEGGVDCTATDGPGAGRFATGAMDFTDRRHVSDPLLTADTRLAGVLLDDEGTRWNADVHYIAKLVNGEFSVKGGGRLVELG